MKTRPELRKLIKTFENVDSCFARIMLSEYRYQLAALNLVAIRERIP